jgi:hypothetical protein
MADRGALGYAARRRGIVDVPRSVFLVTKMALLLEDAEQRAHRGGHRRIRELTVTLRGRCVSAAIDDVHDLPLTAAEVGDGWRAATHETAPGL